MVIAPRSRHLSASQLGCKLETLIQGIVAKE